MALDLILRNGYVFYNRQLNNMSIGIKDGKISDIGHISENSVKVIDVSNKIVIPGGIDPHTHIEGYSKVGTIETGSMAAAMGGTTSILDFSQANKKEDTLEAARSKIQRFKDKSYLDFTIKPMMVTPDFESGEKLESIFNGLKKLDIIAVKIFTTYKNLGRYANNYQLYMGMKIAKKYNIMVQVHAENNDILEGNLEQFAKGNKSSPIYHAMSKPNVSEDLAVADTSIIAGDTGEKSYLVHLSTKNSPIIINEARSHGIDIYGETCPQYLLLNEDFLKRENGNEYLCSPPLRKIEDNDAMWNALNMGYIKAVGSDHVPFLKEQKTKDLPFYNVPNGVPGIETRLPLLFSEGVQKGKISLETFVNVISTNPAKIFGLYPNKGIINIGSDADITVIDPKLDHSLKAEDLHMGSDISLYGHLICHGWPILTISNGEIIMQDGVFTGEKHHGKFLKGKKYE